MSRYSNNLKQSKATPPAWTLYDILIALISLTVLAAIIFIIIVALHFIHKLW